MVTAVTQEELNIVSEGYMAYIEGADLVLNNPYPNGSHKYLLYNFGYNDAHKEIEEVDEIC